MPRSLLHRLVGTFTGAIWGLCHGAGHADGRHRPEEDVEPCAARLEEETKEDVADHEPKQWLKHMVERPTHRYADHFVLLWSGMQVRATPDLAGAMIAPSPPSAPPGACFRRARS